MELVAEKDLVVGVKYYLDEHHEDTGVFVRGTGEEIFFKPLEGNTYIRDAEGLIGFVLFGDYFETV